MGSDLELLTRLLVHKCGTVHRVDLTAGGQRHWTSNFGTGAKVAGPVPLPTRREIYTVNRSTFVNKKSREQFEIRTHKRIIDINDANARTIEALNRLVVPAGVFVKIKA